MNPEIIPFSNAFKFKSLIIDLASLLVVNENTFGILKSTSSLFIASMVRIARALLNFDHSIIRSDNSYIKGADKGNSEEIITI